MIVKTSGDDISEATGTELPELESMRFLQEIQIRMSSSPSLSGSAAGARTQSRVRGAYSCTFGLVTT